MGEIFPPPPSRRPPFQYRPYIPGSYRITPPTSTSTSTSSYKSCSMRPDRALHVQSRRKDPYPTSPASSSASVLPDKDKPPLVPIFGKHQTPPPSAEIYQAPPPPAAAAPLPCPKPPPPALPDNQYVPRLPPPLVRPPSPIIPYSTARHMVPRGRTTMPKSPPKKEVPLGTYDGAPPAWPPRPAPVSTARPDPPGVIRTQQGFVHPRPNLPTESLLAIAHPSTPRPEAYAYQPTALSDTTPSASGEVLPQISPSPRTPQYGSTPSTPAGKHPHAHTPPVFLPDGVGIPFGAMSVRGGGLVNCACPHSHKDQPNVRGVPQPPSPGELEREKVPGYVKQCITRVQANKSASLGHRMCSWCMGRENHVRSYFDRLVSEGQPDRLCWLYARYELERREAVAARDVNTDPRVSMSLRWQTYATAHKGEQITKEQIMEYFRKARELGIVF